MRDITSLTNQLRESEGKMTSLTKKLLEKEVNITSLTKKLLEKEVDVYKLQTRNKLNIVADFLVAAAFILSELVREYFIY